jgi:hypothetical protein
MDIFRLKFPLRTHNHLKCIHSIAHFFVATKLHTAFTKTAGFEVSYSNMAAMVALSKCIIKTPYKI